jgi:integrase
VSFWIPTDDRRKPLSWPALHRWWYRCLTRAGVVDEGTTSGRKMHGVRYTSGTEFYLATGDIYATQQLLGHADVSTTANIYVQGSPAEKWRRRESNPRNVPAAGLATCESRA